MYSKLIRYFVSVATGSAMGMMLSLGGAAAADLSPPDQCAIAKLEATSQAAKCLAAAQIAGIRQGLTDQQVNRRKVVCSQRQQASFRKAENLPGKCKTIGDAAVVDYGLKYATDLPRSCGE